MSDIEIRDSSGRVIGMATGSPEWVQKQLAEMKALGGIDETARVRPKLTLVPKDDPA